MSTSNDNSYSLCMSLLEADTEREIISILQEKGIWNNSIYWKVFDNNENNYSTIGAQQANPVAALVEKVINSIDAVLMRECIVRGIKPRLCKMHPKTWRMPSKGFLGLREGILH